jgi:hypothetical protein
VIIVSGHGGDVDLLAEWWANKLGFETLIFDADWDTYGKRAGFLRNTTIVEHADQVIAFYDGKSKGTADTVAKAREKGIPVRIIGIYYEYSRQV